MFGLVLTMGSLPVSIYLASPYVDGKAIDIASLIMNYFIPITTLYFVVFFFNIESKYLHTFWSTQRSKDMSMAYFLEGESDAIKIVVFESSRHHWVSIEGEIKNWIESNWAKWEEEKPEWLTDVAKATVPVDFIPADGDARRRESVRRASVDAEVEGGLAGTLRASIRRASVGLENGGALIASHSVNDTIQDYAGLDPKQIGQLLGEHLLVALSFILLIPAFLDLALSNETWQSFIISSIVTLGFGITFFISTRNSIENRIQTQDAFLITTLSWIFICIFPIKVSWINSYFSNLDNCSMY